MRAWSGLALTRSSCPTEPARRFGPRRRASPAPSYLLLATAERAAGTRASGFRPALRLCVRPLVAVEERCASVFDRPHHPDLDPYPLNTPVLRCRRRGRAVTFLSARSGLVPASAAGSTRPQSSARRRAETRLWASLRRCLTPSLMPARPASGGFAFAIVGVPQVLSLQVRTDPGPFSGWFRR